MKRFTRHFVEQKDIDSLKYDKVEEKPVPLLKGKDWKNISVPEPPRNSSPEARLELSMIKALGDSRSQKDINSIKEHDMVATYAIRNYLEENDLDNALSNLKEKMDEESLENFMKILDTILNLNNYVLTMYQLHLICYQ